MKFSEIKRILGHAGEQRLLHGLQRIGKNYSRTDMAVRNRNVTVLFALIASMTVGAFVLMALDGQRPIAQAYSLSSYLRLDPAEDAIRNKVTQTFSNWNRIEIYYSGTSGGNADELPLLTNLANGSETQFHFAVCNGSGAEDGDIQAGNSWKNQQLCYGRNGVVRVCVISNGQADSVTDCQIKRTSALVESLIRTFDILPRNIHYPANWQM